MPLDITPLKMYLNYTNPIAVGRYQTPLTLFFKAGYEVKAMDFWISWSKDWALPKFSFIDWIKYGTEPYPTDLYKGFGYNRDLKMYNDPNSKVNFVKTLVSALNLDYSLTKWIGEGKYCDFDFINDEWPM